METKKRGTQKQKQFNLNTFLYSNFKQSIKDLKLIKSYLIFSSTLFLVITLIGVMLPIFFREEIIRLLREIIAQTEGLNVFELTRFIMANNIKSSFLALIFGVLLGIIPLIIIAVNAYVLGFVIHQSIIIEGPLILWRLFPHGIFELPAILISIALGLRLGWFPFTYRKENKKAEFLKYLTQSFRIFILIVVPLLVIAGIIEGILIGFLS